MLASIICLILLVNKFITAERFDQKDNQTKDNESNEMTQTKLTKESCENFENSKQFRILSFKSLKDGKWKKIHTNKDDELGRGGFGKVFVAFSKNGEANGIPQKQCLAVKEIGLGRGKEEISHKGFRNSVKALKAIDKLEETKKRHLLKIYDYGLIGGSIKRRPKRALIIMEKGREGLDERMYNESISDDNLLQQIMAMIKQIVVPIKEMHQVAMHLDVKPHNFLYVPSVNENGGSKELLKLIDFDGAELIPQKKRWQLWRRLNQKDRADYRKKPKNRLTSPMYSSPESYSTLRGCSSKADMWSVGIIIFEIILVRIAKKELTDASNEIFRLAIAMQLFQIMTAYSGKALNLEAKTPFPKRFVYNIRWIDSSAEAVKSILRIWLKFPRLAVLFSVSFTYSNMNLLQILPKKRMTAEGVLAYLDGKCYPAELLSWDYALEGPIFNKISCKKLFDLISQRALMCDHEKCTKQWENFDNILKKVAALRQEIAKESQEMLDSDKHGNKHCATIYSEDGQKGK